MPPQWNAYDDIPDPPLVADRSPLDDILAQDVVPPLPAQPQGIPSDLLTLGDVPEPPPSPTVLPPDDYGIPEPPRATAAPAPVDDMYAIPEPPPVAPEELAPDFAATDYARAQDRLEAPLSVDVAGAAQAAQAAERNYATLGTELAKVQDEVIGLSRKRGELAGQAQALDQRIDELKGTKKRTPEQEAELKASTEQRKGIGDSLKATESEIATGMERFGTAQQQVAAARESYEAARAKADMDMAAGQREAELRGAAAQQAGTEYFIAESKKLDQEYRAKTDKITSDANAARARMDEDRKAYRDALKAGPAKQSVVLTVAAVIGEALAARRTGREPDFGRVIGGLEAATKAQFDDRVKRQLDLVAEGEDTLAKAAQERRILEAEKAARKAEILAGIETDIQSKMGAARGTLQEAQLSTVYSDVRRERERQEAIAMEARAKQAQADEKARLDMDLQKAKIREATAQAGIAERKAGGGGGRAVPSALATLDPYTVYLPGTEKAIAQFGKDAQGAKRAADAMAVIEGRDAAITQINEIEAAIEDYGVKNAGDYTAWTQSPEFAKLQTAIEFLGPSLARVSSGGTATSENDMNWGKGIVQVPTMTSGGKDVALAKLREARRQLEERYRGSLQKVGLPPRVQEQLIAHRRGRSESASDRAKKLIAAAPAVASDSKRSLDDRLAAVEAMKEHAAEAVRARGSEGNQADRDVILDELNALRDVIQRIEDGDDTNDGERVRKAAMERREDLLKIWRKVGSDNATKRERDRLENPATPAALIESEGGIPSIR